MEEVYVKVKRWRQYLEPRDDVRNNSRFRVNHEVIDRVEFAQFSHEEFRAWIYIISLVAKKKAESFRLKKSDVVEAIQVSPASFNTAIRKLERMKLIEILCNEPAPLKGTA